MPKQTPILFNTEMVRAILHNSKFQTRRVVKPQPETMPSEFPIPVDQLVKDLKTKAKKGLLNISTKGATNGMAIPDCPYGEVGDLIWVREKFLFDDSDGIYYYAASMDEGDIYFLKGSFKPSIFLPKIAARIWLKIIDIKIERLKNISEQDAIKEGVFSVRSGHYYLHTDKRVIPDFVKTAKESFFSLWESINGKESLDLNPWVWAITFKKVAKP